MNVVVNSRPKRHEPTGRDNWPAALRGLSGTYVPAAYTVGGKSGVGPEQLNFRSRTALFLIKVQQA